MRLRKSWLVCLLGGCKPRAFTEVDFSMSKAAREILRKKLEK